MTNANSRQPRCSAQWRVAPLSPRADDLTKVNKALTCMNWSGCRDLNPGPPAPKAGALTKLRHIPLSQPKPTLSSYQLARRSLWRPMPSRPLRQPDGRLRVDEGTGTLPVAA